MHFHCFWFFQLSAVVLDSLPLQDTIPLSAPPSLPLHNFFKNLLAFISEEFLFTIPFKLMS